MVIQGTATLAAGCGIQVNSANNAALFLTGQPLCLTSPTMIGVTGGVQGAGNSPCALSTPVQVPPMLDPLEYLHAVAPYYNGACDFNNTLINAGDPATTLTPGTYCCAGTQFGFFSDPDTGITMGGQIPIPSIRISGGTVDFAPGAYTLVSGMQISGSPVVTGDEVTFFNTSSNPNLRRLWGEIQIAGSATVTLVAPTSGDYEGMLFWDDYRAVNRQPSHTIVGDANSVFKGVLYFKQTNVTFGGSNSSAEWTMLVADTITASGNAVVPAEGSFNDGDMLPLRLSVGGSKQTCSQPRTSLGPRPCSRLK